MRAASARLFACVMVGTLVSAWSHPLDAVLSEFAHETGLQLVYVSQVAQARATKGTHAGLSPAAAPRELLDGIGLSFQFVNGRTVRVFATTVVPSMQASPSPRRGRAPT